MSIVWGLPANGPGLESHRVLVTGASGFIGGQLCSRLVATCAAVDGVVRPGRENTVPPGVTPVVADLTDRHAVARLIRSRQPDLVFHLAARVTGERGLGQAAEIMLDSLAQVVNLTTALAETGATRLVLAGSMEEPSAVESATTVPSSPYAASKWAGSGFARMAQALYDLPVVLARLFMVYGPGQKDRTKLIPHVVTSLLRGESPVLSSGRREVDWIHVDDVVDALVAVATTPGLEGDTLDIGSGRLVTIRNLVERITALAGATVAPRFGALPDRPLERPRAADIAHTLSRTGWSPQIELNDGLGRTIEFFRRTEG